MRLITGLTQKAFADMVGLSLSFVEFLEKDKRTMSDEVALRIAFKTGVGAESLKNPVLWGRLFNQDGWVYSVNSYANHVAEMVKINALGHADPKNRAGEAWRKYERFFVEAAKKNVLGDFDMRIAHAIETAAEDLDFLPGQLDPETRDWISKLRGRKPNE